MKFPLLFPTAAARLALLSLPLAHSSIIHAQFNHIRVHQRAPDTFVVECVSVERQTSGIPARNLVNVTRHGSSVEVHCTGCDVERTGNFLRRLRNGQVPQRPETWSTQLQQACPTQGPVVSGSLRATIDQVLCGGGPSGDATNSQCHTNRVDPVHEAIGIFIDSRGRCVPENENDLDRLRETMNIPTRDRSPVDLRHFYCSQETSVQTCLDSISPSQEPGARIRRMNWARSRLDALETFTERFCRPHFQSLPSQQRAAPSPPQQAIHQTGTPNSPVPPPSPPTGPTGVELGDAPPGPEPAGLAPVR